MLSIKVICQTVAASVSATGVILGLSGSAKVAAQAIADNMAPSLHLPALTGSYQVGTTSYDFVDPSRDDIYAPEPTDKRELIAKVWYPSVAVSGATPAPYLDQALARAVAPGFCFSPDNFIALTSLIQTHANSVAAVSTAKSSYPVLLFSPGFGGLPEVYTFLAEELASHGYIVVSINHTYDSIASVFPDGRIALQSPLLRQPTEQDFTQDVEIRAADAVFVLNELEHLNASDSQGLFTGHLNLKRVGILGHSLGGATAASAMLQDHRFKAGVDMDGQLYGNVVQQGLEQPFMLLNSESGGTLNPTLEPFYEHLKNDAYNLTIKGAGHLNFTDESLLFQQLEAYSPALAAQLNNDNSIGSIDANRGAQIIDDYTLAFFDKYLKNQNSPLLNGADPNYPEVQFSSRHGRHSNFSPRAELCSRVYDFCRHKSLVQEQAALRH